LNESNRACRVPKQVDELILKCLVNESKSSCVVLALLVSKKDVSWRMCIDSRAMNKIIIGYQFFIPRLDDVKIMNDMLKPFIDIFIIVYFNDILVYNKDKKEHRNHLQEVFQTLKSQKFYANLKKCEFFTSSFVFLGFVAFNEGMKMDLKKIKTILSWPHP
jgi:hypothetical protein